MFCLRTLLLYFYPRPPRGGRPSPHFRLVRVHLFLSTPSARRATEEIYEKDKIQLFLSTPSARRATCCLFFLRQVDIISIHALREEGDLIRLPRFHCAPYFYPRPPRGGRRRTAAALAATRRFLSTPSARRATESGHPNQWHNRYFYPRPPRGGRPDTQQPANTSTSYFYPRPPRGGRPTTSPSQRSNQSISIHALREEGDSKNRDKISIFKQIIQHSARI